MGFVKKAVQDSPLPLLLDDIDPYLEAVTVIRNANEILPAGSVPGRMPGASPAQTRTAAAPASPS
jgi:hypothetical protein